MIKSSLKILYVAFLILFMGSTNSMDADDADGIDASIRAVNQSLNVRILRALNQGTVKGEEPFARAVLGAENVAAVNALLANFRDFPPTKKESAVTAIIVQAVSMLEEADARDPHSQLVAVRLASFLLGNRLLAPVYAWLDNDAKRVGYLRGLESVDGRSSKERAFLKSFTQGFIEGAKVFGRTYEDFLLFIREQQANDRARESGILFGEVMLMPDVGYIFNEAVRTGWQLIDIAHEEISYGSMAPRGRRPSHTALSDAGDTRSEAGSTTTAATIAPGAVFPLLEDALSAEAAANDFANRLLVDHGAARIEAVDDLLREFAAPAAGSSAAEVLASTNKKRETILSAVVIRAIRFLHDTDCYRNRQAWWVTARLASFLLGNRFLPPFHEWLDVVNAGPTDDSEPENVAKLKYLMDPRDGRLVIAMRNLSEREDVQQSLSEREDVQQSPSTTNILGLTQRFKSAVVEFPQTYSDVTRITRVQRLLDVIGFGKERIMPNMLQLFNLAMQRADARIREEGERLSQVGSPVRTAALERSLHRVRDSSFVGADGHHNAGVLIPNTADGATASSRLVVTAGSVNSSRDETPGPERPFWKRLLCCCC